ncbi:hypothetical protein J6590_064738 [Homalodisca vitripennis]|nr:hypothetical protein J6590_090812 [Homalodisca vitripennis]KAG8256607.1 hypothetical protein J6590_064738 [Homalodisca vitripennis]
MVSACQLWNALPVNIRAIDKRARFGAEVRALMLGAQGRGLYSPNFASNKVIFHFISPSTSPSFYKSWITYEQESPCPSLIPKEGGITVAEADMREVFEEVMNTPSIALPHSVPSDFHMSAGVAVTFREKFGRSQTSDLIYDNLAKQKIKEGPTIYSLHDFKSQGLSTLICSAMGCVRDLIEPQHFVSNIINFHTKTGANVKVVTYDQEARRTLWRGLEHDKFVETLRRLIVSQLPTAATQEEEPMTGTNTSTLCPARASSIVRESTSPKSQYQCLV